MIDPIFGIIDLIFSLLTIFFAEFENGRMILFLLLFFCPLLYCFLVLTGEMLWCVPLGC